MSIELYNDDNLNILNKFDDNSVDAYIFDPPFNSDRTYLSNPDDDGDVSKMNDVWSGGEDTYLDELEERLEEMYRTLTSRGLVVCHCDDTVGFEIYNSLKRCGFHFRRVIKWSYAGGGGPKKNLPHKCDYLWVFMKSKDENLWAYHKINRHYADSTKSVGKHSTLAGEGSDIDIDLESGTSITDVWDTRCEELERVKAKEEGWGWVFNPDFGPIKPVTGWAGPKGNTEKPEALYCRIIHLFTDLDYLIVDPYMGTGTTLVAAHRLGRSAIGVEFEHDAYKRARNKLKINEIKYTERGEKNPINNDIDHNSLSDHEWAEYFINLVGGKNTKRVNDGGVDGERKSDYTFIECKKHNSKVGPKYIRDFATGMEVRRKNKEWPTCRGLVISYRGFTKATRALVSNLKRNHGVYIDLKTGDEIIKERYGSTVPILNLFKNKDVVTAQITGFHKSIVKYVWVAEKVESNQLELSFLEELIEKEHFQTKIPTLDLTRFKNYGKLDKLTCKVFDSVGDRVSREMLLSNNKD